MRGKVLKPHFPLVITLLCLGSLLTSLIWYNNNVDPHRRPPLKKNPSLSSEPCKGCKKVIDKVAENNTETSKKQEDKPEKIREVNDKAVEQNSEISNKQEDNPPQNKEGDSKAVESKISKKQEDNPPKNKEVIDKKSNSETSKNQEDKPKNNREINDKAVEQNSEISNKQEDNPPKNKEGDSKVLESKILKKQEDNPPQNKEVIDKKSNSETSKNQEDKPKNNREINDKAVEQNSEISNKQEDNPPKNKEGDSKVLESKILKKQEDNPPKNKEVIDKKSNSETSKNQEDKPKNNRESDSKAVESKISKNQEDNPPKNNKVIDKVVESKQEDKSQKIREVIDKKNNSETSKNQEDKPKNNSQGDSKAVEFKVLKKEEDTLQKIKKVIDKAVERYSQTWKKQENNYQKLRSNLSSECHGLDKALITQNNKPVGSQIVYDADKKILQVTPELFSIFMKEHPFSNKTWDTCAVVGNGGILTNSSCGETIDSAQFVIRCNLPSLGNEYEKHVGNKTDLVTANPSIFFNRYGGLTGRRRQFVENVRIYGNSLLLLPAFSFSGHTAVAFRAIDAIKDFEIPIRPVFFDPEYLKSLLLFWRSQGLKEKRLSTGLIMTSLALELCSNVHLYGFWPFSNHPHDLHPLTNHYYDDVKATKFHNMPAEFDFLLQLHSQGVLRIHLGDCQPGGK